MWIIFALLAALTAGISVTLAKSGLKKVDPVLAFAVQAIIILAITWGTVLIQKKQADLRVIDRQSWWFLVGAGAATCLSSLFQFSALKLGQASLTAPLVQLSLVFSIVFAIVFLKEEFNWKVVAGGFLMVSGAVIIALSRKS